MQMNRKTLATLAGAAILASTGVWAAECENPDELTFAMIPTEETVAELELYKPVTDRMAAETGKGIQFFMPTSYASVVEGLLSKFIDVAVLGPYSYVIANNKDKEIEVFATYAKRPGHLQEDVVLVLAAHDRVESPVRQEVQVLAVRRERRRPVLGHVVGEVLVLVRNEAARFDRQHAGHLTVATSLLAVTHGAFLGEQRVGCFGDCV